MATVTPSVSSPGASSLTQDGFQAGMDAIAAQSMADELTKADRDRKGAFVAGYQGSETTMISAFNQNHITY